MKNNNKKQEKELLNYKKILDDLPQGIHIVDKTGKIIYMNKFLLKVFGKKSIGKKCYEVYKENKKQCEDCPLKESINIGETKILEVSGVVGEKVFSISHKGITIGNEKFILELFEDITEKKQAEKNLIKNEEKYHALFESTHDMIQAVRPDGRFDFVNKSWLKTFGYTKKEVEKINIWDIVHPDSLVHCKKSFTLLMKGGIIGDIEATFITKKGKAVKVEGHVTLFKQEGDTISTFGFFRNITQRTQAEEALRESKERYEALVQSSPDCIKLLDKKGEIMFINKAGITEHTFKNLQNALGTDWKKSISKKSMPAVKKALRAAFLGDTSTIEIQHAEKESTHDHCLMSFAPIKEADGEINSVHVVSRNITELKKIEEDLKESEKRFRDMALSSVDWIWEVDVEGRYTFVSEGIKKDLGYTPKEVMGKTPFDLMPKEEAKRVGKIFQGIMAKKDPIVDLENTNRTKKGKDIFLLTNAVPILDDVGKLIGYRGVDKNITEKKKAEQALKESEEKHRLLYETSSDAIMTLEPPTWDFTSGNPAIMKMFGVKNEKEFTSLKPWQVSPKYQLDGQLSSVKAKKMISIAMKKGSNFFEWTHKKVVGDDFFATVLLNKVETNGKAFLQARVSDITEKKRAEQDLSEKMDEVQTEKDKIDTIIQSIGDGMFVVDRNAKILLFNKAASDMSGFSEKEVRGKNYDNILRFVSEKDLKPDERLIKDIISTGEIRQMKNHIILIDKKKKHVPVSVGAAPLFGEGKKIIGCVVVFRDTTRERHIENLKSEFVSVASHQLRTPLSAINWYAEMLLNGDAGKMNAEQSMHVQEIYRGNQRMVELVNSLLNVSRLELGTFMIEPTKLQLLDIANDAVEEVEIQAAQKKIKISKIYPKVLKELDLDKKLIYMVFQNLLSNAVKYTPEKGKVFLTIKKEKTGILIEIKDTGMGIPKSQQHKIFTKLFRADNVRETDTEGTGLGLYIIKQIMDQVGGEIWFKSAKNKGTTFSILLPLKGMKKKEGAKSLS